MNDDELWEMCKQFNWTQSSRICILKPLLKGILPYLNNKFSSDKKVTKKKLSNYLF